MLEAYFKFQCLMEAITILNVPKLLRKGLVLDVSMPHGSHHNFKQGQAMKGETMETTGFQCLMEAITILNNQKNPARIRVFGSFNASWKPSQF